MLRLSWPSSQHLLYVYSFNLSDHVSDMKASKPYRNVGEDIRDIARRGLWNARKKLGFPSSRDIGVLSNMIQALRDQALLFVGKPIRAAAASIPHLAALYGEDLLDAFEYLGLVYLEFYPFSNFRPIHASIAAYAGNGLGFCADYRNITACKEEELQIPAFFALTIAYTHRSLTASQARLGNAYDIREETAMENLTLGYDSRHGYSDKDAYWEAVRDVLRHRVVTSAIQRNFSKVLLHGDAVEVPKFRAALEEVLEEVVEGTPGMVDQQPEMSAAKGVAEMAKRAIFGQIQELDLNNEL